LKKNQRRNPGHAGASAGRHAARHTDPATSSTCSSVR
jgi:hypothetical protein